jgi:hypothetical protein
LTSAYDIYHQLTSGPGSQVFRDPQRVMKNIRDRQNDRIRRIALLADKIGSGWQGESADGATTSTYPLLTQLSKSAKQLDDAQDLLGRDADSFDRARNEVRPLPPNPPQSTMINDLLPWESDLDKKIKQYQEDANHNIAVFAAYDQESLYNETNMPQDFGTVDDSAVEVSVHQLSSSGGGSGQESGSQGRGSGTVPGGGQTVVVTGDGGSSVVLPPGGEQQHDVLPHEGTRLDASVPGTTPDAPGTSLAEARGDAGRPGAAGLPSGLGQSGYGSSGRSGGGEPGYGGNGRSGGAEPGDGTSGRSSAGRPGDGSNGRSNGGRHVGARVGRMPIAERWAPGGRASAGSAMGPVGRQEKGEDDYEHQTASYLDNPDPEATFGDDRPTAPPVIGG